MNDKHRGAAADRLRLVQGIARDLAMDLPAEAVFSRVLSKLTEALGADGALLFSIEKIRTNDAPESSLGIVPKKTGLLNTVDGTIDPVALVLTLNSVHVAELLKPTLSSLEVEQNDDLKRTVLTRTTQIRKVENEDNPVWLLDWPLGLSPRWIITSPLMGSQQQLSGALQLLRFNEEPFDNDDVALFETVAAQFTIVMTNRGLVQDIENLFESFVRASVGAIEARDPTTSGHSERVAKLTVELAKVVDGECKGPFADFRISANEMQELRYAALLHDFGKIAVKEDVLTKSKKLSPKALELLLQRYDLIALAMERDIQREKFQLLENGNNGDQAKKIVQLDRQLCDNLEELKNIRLQILQANEPTVLPAAVLGNLQQWVERQYSDPLGRRWPFLTDEELFSLSVTKGSLNEQERLEIEAHVQHTFEFLKKIPWTPHLRRIPAIAYAHHEKLDRSGYPRQVGAMLIPVQTRMLTLSDIYDALTASDRPYKKALSPTKALDILGEEVRAGKLDSDLFNLFVEARVFAKISGE